jgi:hypothetical protein
MKVNLLCCTMLVFTMLSNVLAQSEWKWRNPLPQGNALKSVTYGDNQLVASFNCMVELRDSILDLADSVLVL